MDPATHILTVVGKSIGRERGLKPIPVRCPPEQVGCVDTLTATIVATVRRCLPLAERPHVDWETTRKVVVWVDTDHGPFEVARFRVADVHHHTGGQS